MSMKQAKKSMCFLLLISVLLLGTCLGNIQACSVYFHALSASDDGSSNTDASIGIAGKSLPVRLFLSEKNSGPQETAAQIRRFSQKTGIRFSRGDSAVLFADGQLFAAKAISSFFAMAGSAKVLLGLMVIICYIHHQDGQKSYLPFLL